MASSTATFKLLSSAKLPLAVGLMGLLLSFGGGNDFLKRAGTTTALVATGAAAVSLSSKDKTLAEIAKLQRRHSAQIESLENSAIKARSEAAKAQQLAQQYAAVVEQNKGVVATLKAGMADVAAERDRMRQEILDMRSQVNNCSASLRISKNDNSELAGELESLQVERMQLIYELYETAVTEADLGSAIASLENQFKNDSAYQLTQKKKLKSEMTAARANFHTQIADAEAATTEAHDRIAELEKQLAQKTELAQALLADLEGEAKGQLTQLGGKASAQNEMIRSLQLQLEEARKTIKAHTFKRFDTIGTDNIWGNRLIDYLAKKGSLYGAYDTARDSRNGRLKVWLTMVDATIKNAKDSLEDMEGELGLKFAPTVKIDKGMHLFTLPTEPEYATEKSYSDNLNRLEKDFDLMNHIRLVGGTGSGKSTFLDNLIWLGKLLWPTADMDLLDPKAPYTKWQGDLTPDFKNLECVAAIENISRELQERFNEANKVADEFGNDSNEFEQFVNELPYKLFVLDEAQYLYRIARAEDGKEKPKGIRANTVRDSLLDCLGVGRALKVKGYFITQSAKCSKINMNEDDFDNATSIFLNAAIANALEGELKDSFPSSKIDRVLSEYEARKAAGQKYIGLVAHADSDKLYLFQPPQPGYFHQRVLTAKQAVVPGPTDEGQNAETTTDYEIQVGAEQGAKEDHPLAAPVHPPACPSPDLVTEGTAACPSCGTFSTSIKDGLLNSRGKVKFRCKNTACKKQTFSAKPIA